MSSVSVYVKKAEDLASSIVAFAVHEGDVSGEKLGQAKELVQGPFLQFQCLKNFLSTAEQTEPVTVALSALDNALQKLQDWMQIAACPGFDAQLDSICQHCDKQVVFPEAATSADKSAAFPARIPGLPGDITQAFLLRCFSDQMLHVTCLYIACHMS